LSEAELKQKREKEGTLPFSTAQLDEAPSANTHSTVLYFRHKLQKGFLSSNEPPKEAEMATMAEYFTSLEGLDDLEQTVIRTTKIHKVLKAILKLGNIPKDEDYNFKTRSTALLNKWQKVLADGGGEDGDKTEVAAAEEKKEEDVNMTDAAKDESAEETKTEEAEVVEAAEETDNAPAVEETKEDVPAETPAEETTAEAAVEDAPAANNLL